MKMRKVLWVWAGVLVCSWNMSVHASTFGVLLKIADQEMVELFTQMLDKQGITGAKQAQIIRDVTTTMDQLKQNGFRANKISPEVAQILQRPANELEIGDYLRFVNWAVENAAKKQGDESEKHYRLQFTMRQLNQKRPDAPPKVATVAKRPTPPPADLLPALSEDFEQLIDTYRPQISTMSAQMNEQQKAAYYSYWRAFDSKFQVRKTLALRLLPLALMPVFRPEYGPFFALFNTRLHGAHFLNLLQTIDAIGDDFYRVAARSANHQVAMDKGFVEMLVKNEELNIFINLLLVGP